MSRARRRKDKERMKAKARRLYPYLECPEKLADHLKNCSCHLGCGNPRNNHTYKCREQLTIQELKANERDEIDRRHGI